MPNYQLILLGTVFMRNYIRPINKQLIHLPMIREIKIITAKGDCIFAQVEDINESIAQGPVPASRKVPMGQLNFEELIDRYLLTNANAFHASLVKMEHPPESAEISFGLNLGGTIGAAIGKVGVDSTYNVKLTWRGIHAD